MSYGQLEGFRFEGRREDTSVSTDTSRALSKASIDRGLVQR